MQGLLIGGLNPDLQLHKSGTHIGENFKLFLCHNIRCHFKMKICDTIVMSFDIAPDFHGMSTIAVKGPVHKFYLRHLSVKEKLKLPLHLLHAAKADLSVHGGQAVNTPKRATSAGFIIKDPVPVL